MAVYLILSLMDFFFGEFSGVPVWKSLEARHVMLQLQMLRLPYDVSYLRRVSENWRHRRGLWQILIAVTYRTATVRCPLPFYAYYSASPARPPYDSLIVCKNNPAATVRSPHGHRTAAVRSPYDVKIIVPKSYGNRTATVRRCCVWLKHRKMP